MSVMGDITKRDKKVTYTQTDKQSLAKFNIDLLLPNNNIFPILKLVHKLSPIVVTTSCI